MFKAFQEKKHYGTVINGVDLVVMFTGLILPKASDVAGAEAASSANGGSVAASAPVTTTTTAVASKKKEPPPQRYSTIPLISADLKMIVSQPKNGPTPLYDYSLVHVEACERFAFFKCWDRAVSWVYGGIYDVPGVTWSSYVSEKYAKAFISLECKQMREKVGASQRIYKKRPV